MKVANRKPPSQLRKEGFVIFTVKLSSTQLFCTETGKLIEHIYGFLMIVERILAKYDEKNSEEKNE